MERHYTYFIDYFPGEAGVVLEKFSVGVVLGAVLLLVGTAAASKLKRVGGVERQIVPTKRVSLFGLFDVFIEGFVAFQDSILGKERRRFLPLTGSIFLFIFASNLLGLIPGMPAVTTAVPINVGIAVLVFISFNSAGLGEHGLLGYVKHFFGSPQLLKGGLFFVGLLVAGAEVLSAVLRILTLNLRLYWNISADHLVLGTMTGLVPYLVPIPFYILGTLVAFMQAFVFTVLTMIYLLLATQHEESHEH